MKRFLVVIMALLVLASLAGCGSQPEKAAAPAPEPPKAKTWQSSDVVSAFKAAGLECESTRAMTKDDYGFAPLVAKEGTRFLIPSLGDDSGGRIMSFENKEDLEKTKEYYVKMGRESAAFFSWTFTKDNILVQINGDLKEDKAKKYEETLNGMK